MKNNVDYKASADLHHRLRTFNIRDYVMVHIRLERFPPGTVKKLHAWSAEPFQMLKNSNAYVVDLPPDLASVALLILRTWFHIEVPLIPLLTHSWMSQIKTFFLRAPLPPLPPKLSYAIENIDSILDDQIVSTRDGGTRHYLIKWKGKLDSENSWILRRETSGILIPIDWSAIRANYKSVPLARRGRVLSTRGNWWGHHAA